MTPVWSVSSYYTSFSPHPLRAQVEPLLPPDDAALGALVTFVGHKAAPEVTR